MKRTKFTYLLSLLLLFQGALLSAQTTMGSWRTHLAYNAITGVADSESKVYGLSDGALFSVDKEDQNIELYSKLSGLNGNLISKIKYDDVNKQLIILYSNGNIDLLSSGGVINVADFYTKQIAVNKTINFVDIYNNKAYLSCSFGIVVLELTKREIADTYYIGANGSDVNVLATTVHNGYVYAISSSTIYKGLASEPNLVNYQYWQTLAALPGSGNIEGIASYGGKLVLQRGGKLFTLGDDNVWTPVLTGLTVRKFQVSRGKMIVYDNSTSVYFIDETFNSTTQAGLGTINDGVYDLVNNKYWLGEKTSGIIGFDVATLTAQAPLKPNGPASNIPWDIKFSGKKLFMVAGGRWAAQYQREGLLMMYEDGAWTNIYGSTIKSAIAANVKSHTNSNYPVKDFMSIAVDPLDNKHFFVSAYGNGLFEFRNNQFYEVYNHLNSTLDFNPAVPTQPLEYIRLDGVVYDNSGNLLVVNSASSTPIKMLAPDGITWSELSYPVASKPTLGDIVISNQNVNQKWVTSVRGSSSQGIFVYDDKGTLDDQSDDQSKFFSSFTDSDNPGNNILPSFIYCLAQDHDGVVWAGTDIGPLLFYNPQNVFNADYTCSRVIIPRNDGTGLGDYLLQGEKVTAIAIDGANRKWIGTEGSGVFLMSANGQQTIQHFTTDNSPLISNTIMSIAINSVSGEVYFGTGNGLMSYQSDAVDGASTFTNVHAYPNPVREDFEGIITITGLIADTRVKITDLNGNLIHETISNGGIATWDGKDVHGRRVSTGIYLAICASADGTQNAITKIMIIN